MRRASGFGGSPGARADLRSPCVVAGEQMHSRRPSGLQARSETLSGSVVSWLASPPSIGSSQTCVASTGCFVPDESTGTGRASRGRLPASPARSTEPRSDRNASVRPSGLHRGAVSFFAPSVSRRAGADPSAGTIHSDCRYSSRSGLDSLSTKAIRLPSGESRTSIGTRSAKRSSGRGARRIGLLARRFCAGGSAETRRCVRGQSLRCRAAPEGGAHIA